MAIEHARQDDLRVLILPATRRDGEATGTLLEQARLHCLICANALDLATQIEHAVGAIVMTDAIVSDPWVGRLLTVLGGQPEWSDVPIVLLGRVDAQSSERSGVLGSLSNVTLLDRPTSTRTLLSAVQAALRTRKRQYQIRDQIAALRAAEDALRAADRRKDEFLAMLAHELRNPLSPILTASEVLERTVPLDAKSKTTVAIVKRQVKHLTRLVDDLLDVSRITQGRIQLHRQPLDIATVVAQALESVEPLLRQKRHRLRVDTGQRPMFVNGDSARLVQCVGNVLTNAAKYTDAGGEIELTVSEAADAVAIAISDNGVGIPEELLPRIFDLFVQNDRSLDRAEGGLGVGLSVVKRLVEMHQGQVAAYSAGPGHGSRFEMCLPSIAAPQALGHAALMTRVAPKRVLIVDDNVDAANCLALLLAVEGHVIETTYSAAEALGRAQEFAAEVILLDIGLPGMDGFEAARQIRARGSNAFLVAVSGYGQADDIRRGRQAGFDAHLVKPVDLASLNRILGAGAAQV